MSEAPEWNSACEAMRWLNEVEIVQGGRNGPTIKLRAAIEAMQAEAAHALYMVRADKSQALMEAEKAMAQIREKLNSRKVPLDICNDAINAAVADALRDAQSYATTLAMSMHKQHYAEAAPNWQPLPDLVGVLTQIDNMYAGLRNDLEAERDEALSLAHSRALVIERHEAAIAAAVAKERNRISQLIRDNYQDYSTIADLCDFIARKEPT